LPNLYFGAIFGKGDDSVLKDVEKCKETDTNNVLFILEMGNSIPSRSEAASLALKLQINSETEGKLGLLFLAHSKSYLMLCQVWFPPIA